MSFHQVPSLLPPHLHSLGIRPFFTKIVGWHWLRWWQDDKLYPQMLLFYWVLENGCKQLKKLQESSGIMHILYIMNRKISSATVLEEPGLRPSFTPPSTASALSSPLTSSHSLESWLASSLTLFLLPWKLQYL